MPLTLLGVGVRRNIIAVKGDYAVKKHLHNLGFVEGAEIEVIADNSGDLIVGLYGSRVALNKDLAKRIIV